ncbi:MAG: D-alanine--poly(phosphoribitol) ligase [Blastocatellia bacterium AA13]|nr:MAG: D-alanine--poly(phosphoribitol) ligase [Blastocatellia bacterium AA13]
MTSLLQDWLARQADRRPESSALVMKDERMTYGELEARSNQLARLLKAAGCKRGDRICFLIPKSTAAIVSMLGILKADCIHVPLDTSSPVPRLAKIMQQCEPRFLLAGGAVENSLTALVREPFSKKFRIGWMSDAAPAGITAEFSTSDLPRYSPNELTHQNRGDDPAHILFTSGSTGIPKGVVITHSNVARFVEWAARYFGITSSDRISGHSPLHFDLSTFDIFGALAAGAELHMVPTEMNLLPGKLAEFIRASELTQWFSVPSVLNNMAKFDVVRFDDFPSLKRVLWCGEVFPTPALIYWMRRLPQVQFTNLYGPTEATIASSYYTVPVCPKEESAPVPLGSPCDGEELLVLNNDFQPVSSGQTGELYIRGAGLSPGYWNNPDKTASAFLVHPQSTEGDRIYKTGDLAKKGADDLIYFVGRADTQIKSRGYRIELGEIEAALSTIEILKEGAVVAIESEGFEGALICCAYAAFSNENTTPVILRKRLSEILPGYMIPQRWMHFERLPQNANGKIDRSELKRKFSKEIGGSDDRRPSGGAIQ